MRPVTLLGMSGAGKTHFAQRLAMWGWAHFSCDYEIGARYLAEHLDGAVAVDDLSALSSFVGQVGDQALGGLSLDVFKARQQMYIDAEMDALRNMPIVEGQRFVNDSTGSFCEILDEDLIASVAAQSLLVYIETDEESHKEVIARAVEYPKPLYFPSAQFDVWLAAYCDEKQVAVDGIVPNDFSAWVFPRLFASRLPKYERLAEAYGVKVSAADLHACDSEAAFLELINGRSDGR